MLDDRLFIYIMAPSILSTHMNIIDLIVTRCPKGRRNIIVPIQSIANDFSKLIILRQILCTLLPDPFDDTCTDLLNKIVKSTHKARCSQLEVTLDYGRVLMSAANIVNDENELQWVVEKIHRSTPNKQLPSLMKSIETFYC